MATKIKINKTGDFLEVSPEGTIDLTKSRKLLVDIARADHPMVDYELLIDFRDAKFSMSITDIYTIASELYQQGDTFQRKVALLLLPKHDFNKASFLEKCAHKRGFSVEVFTDFESAMRWFSIPEIASNSNTTHNKADAGDGK